MWGEGLTPSLQATGPEDLPSTGLAVWSSSRPLLEWGHPQLPGLEVKPQLCPLTGMRRVTPRRRPPKQSTFLGVCRQWLTQWADPGKVFLERDPDGRF